MYWVLEDVINTWQAEQREKAAHKSSDTIVHQIDSSISQKLNTGCLIMTKRNSIPKNLGNTCP